MTGVVLCGGQSTRMGQDKGLLHHASGTWAQAATEKLRALQLPVLVSVNEQQYDTYSKLFQKAMVVVDDATIAVEGPLAGVLAAHLQYRQEDLLILACDMRDMQLAVLEHLLATFANSNAEAMVFQNDDYIEPLCGIYAARGLNKVYEQYEHGLLKKFSMHAILQLLQTRYLQVSEYWKGAFKNFNAAEDLPMGF
jgi:molybdopterin-guanine dinucleotide biosynthesis protein A